MQRWRLRAAALERRQPLMGGGLLRVDSFTGGNKSGDDAIYRYTEGANN